MLDSSALSKDQWLSYLETCHPKFIDLGLDRIKVVAKQLDVLNFDCPIITVAGTNGKGSCVALIQTILNVAGYRVGSYTSPHLLDFNERIQIANKVVSDTALCAAFEQIEKACCKLKRSLTYFEFATLAALCLFKQAKLDAIILEVGLGGRLDAVNCVDADISVISTIDLDHTEWLGDTRECIGQEKAGIMRPNKPCVFGDFLLPASVSRQAALCSTPLYFQGQEFKYKKQGFVWSWKSQQQTLNDLPLPRIDLQNAATVLQVIELLSQRFIITRHSIDEGLKKVFLPGRFQIIEKNSTQFILDVAHNPAGAKCLAKRLANESCTGKTHAVVGMLGNKDIENTLAALTNQIDYWYLTDLEVPRSATVQQLHQCLMSLKQSSPVFKFSSPHLAVQRACKELQKGDRILVFGSFHTVAFMLNDILSEVSHSMESFTK